MCAYVHAAMQGLSWQGLNGAVGLFVLPLRTGLRNIICMGYSMGSTDNMDAFENEMYNNTDSDRVSACSGFVALAG